MAYQINQTRRAAQGHEQRHAGGVGHGERHDAEDVGGIPCHVVHGPDDEIVQLPLGDDTAAGGGSGGGSG